MFRMILSLFMTRLGRYYKLQYRMWRTALDWTVALYIIIPGLFLTVGTYRSWWQQPPDWLLGLPEALAAIVMLAFVWFGRLRTFKEEADVLILRQQPAIMRGLTGLGIIFTVMARLVLAAALFGVLSVWFVRVIGLTAEHLIWWHLFTAASGATITILKHLIVARWKGWRQFAAVLASIALSVAYVMPVLRMLEAPQRIAALQPGALLAWIVLALAAAIRLRIGETFAHDVREEQKAKLAGIDLLLSQTVERKPTIRLRRPLLFRRSRRLFRRDDTVSVLVEMRLKSFLRKLSNVQLMFSFLGLSSLAVIMTPVWLSIPLALVLPGIAATWLHQEWKTWMAEPFLAQFQWNNAETGSAAFRSALWLLAPCYLWLIALAVWHAL